MMTAFFTGHCRPNDYKIFWAFLGCFILWIATTVLLYIFVQGNNGWVSTMPFAYIYVCVVLATAVTDEGRPLNLVEHIIFAITTFVYVGIGVAFLVTTYDVTKFTRDLSKALPSQFRAALFGTLYVFFIPTLGHLLVPLAWVSDYGPSEVWSKHKYFVVFTIIYAVGIITSVFLFIDWVRGLALLVALVIFTYYVQTIFQYFTNNFYLEPRRLLAT